MRTCGGLSAEGRWRTCLPAGRTGRRTTLELYDFCLCHKKYSRNVVYVGMTNHLERRLKEHDNGENRSTKAYRPFELIYFEEFETRIDARKKEKYLKSGVGKEYLKSLK